MSVFAYCAAKPRGILFRMTRATKRIPRHPEIRRVGVAVNLMTIEAAKPAVVHCALDKVIALHPVLMRCQVCILIKVGSSRLGLFELPIVRQSLSRQKPYRPVIVLTLNWVNERPPLAVALHARVRAAHIIQLLWIDYVLARWMLNVKATWSMALLAANIPLRHILGRNVVVD